MISRCHTCERVGLALALAGLLGFILFAGSLLQALLEVGP